MKIPKPVILSGREVLPIIEGGKGVAVTNGQTAGAFAAAGAVGTFSGVLPDRYDADGQYMKNIYDYSTTRLERFRKAVQYSIEGAIEQAKIAHEKSGGSGRIFMNMLWEAGGAQEAIKGVLEGAKGLVHGIVCGAGMPFKLGEIASHYQTWYYPIVSSSRAFRILWTRSYSKVADYLGGVVYEDPWLAGGHNGLSNAEDPDEPQNPYHRIRELRTFMNSVGLEKTPIIIAGGVWSLDEWQDYIDNPEIGEVAFQFGTRPMLTKESPISQAWRDLLRSLNKGDIGLNRFSPTGFWSSAIKNNFLKDLYERSKRQIAYKDEQDDDHPEALPTGGKSSPVIYVSYDDRKKADDFIAQGFTKIVRTPDQTVVFLTKENAKKIRLTQSQCVGCISQCAFSNWTTRNEQHSTGKLPDPRSYCIQKNLVEVAHGGDVQKYLAFSGHHGWRFAQDPLFQDGKEPSIKELIEAIMQGR